MLIEGLNGAGKTSLVEALHYVCYLRSFRTHSPRELLHFGQESFFLKATCANSAQEQYEIQVGFSAKKRLVKIDQRVVSSYRELMDFYRVITLTEDDMVLIQGGPEVRRSFIDQAIVLYNPEFAKQLRLLRTIIDNRTSLLQHGTNDPAYHAILTEQLWTVSVALQLTRSQALAALEKATNELLALYFSDQITISLTYQAKKIDGSQSFQDFYAEHTQLFADERRYGRSLFGAHLDDFSIHFEHKRSKSFASRGQQKLIVLLIKIAQLQQLKEQKGPAILMLDDFMTDFDSERSDAALQALMALDAQLIFTAPARAGLLEEKLRGRGVQTISLTH